MKKTISSIVKYLLLLETYRSIMAVIIIIIERVNLVNSKTALNRIK